jgi:drug/metabolite transporter (DMT)-like permease
LAAGAWLGLAEAPTKLVAVGLSPFTITIGMVSGVFVARWTVPMLLKGTAYVYMDVRSKPHLIVWGILAGMLWAVANTLTVFAIRDVGLSIAFPLWNLNCLVGLFWGWLLFNELRGSSGRQRAKVIIGASAIVMGACLTAYATTRGANSSHHRMVTGILAALGAAVLWGTMYVPYRKAYLSGMNPLSFVTIFTFGEFGTTVALGVSHHGLGGLLIELDRARPMMFWLFLGGFCWVLGDLFQHYAAKYIGISRGIPLSNTNQLWGLAWGALVFGELKTLGSSGQLLVLAGSATMLVGVMSISISEAAPSERDSWQSAVERECDRYNLDAHRIALALDGSESDLNAPPRRKWELAIVLLAVGLFAWLLRGVRSQPIAVNIPWLLALSFIAVFILVACGAALWRRTRFS